MFADENTPVHVGGGGHGGLHRDDTIVPVIISGTKQELANNRLIDLKPFILSLFK